MKIAIVYSSRTGNTRQLADAIHEALEGSTVIYFGAPDAKALEADRIYAGFWTDKGSCDADTAQFLKTVTNQELFLFGTAGFGGSQEFFAQVLKRASKNIGKDVRVIGTYMCQGKMPMSVRERYEKMQKSPIPVPNIKGMIENFDKALSHPDQADLDALKAAVRG